MKKISFLSLLLVAMCANIFAEGRTYFIFDEFLKQDQYTYQPYNNIWIWQRDYVGETKPNTLDIAAGADAGPNGAMYTEMTADAENDGWGGLAFVYEKCNIDLSKVTENDVLSFYVKTNIYNADGTAVNLTIVGADNTKYDLAINNEMLSQAERDNKTWKQISIPVYQMMDKGWKPGVITGTNVMFIQLNVNTLTKGVSKISFAELFIGDPNDTPVQNISADSQKAVKTIEDGQIVIYRGNTRYNALGIAL